MGPLDESRRRDGPSYRVSAEEQERFQRDGYVHLRGVLSDEELAEIERYATETGINIWGTG